MSANEGEAVRQTLENRLPKIFSSPERHFVRNNAYSVIGLIVVFFMFTSMFVKYNILIVIPISALTIWYIRNSYKLREEKAGIIYNAVDVTEESLEFAILSKKGKKTYTSKISLINIIDVLVRDVKTDSAIGITTVTVFEFKHRYGQSEMLRYDLDEREEFEQILISKGHEIKTQEEEPAVMVAEKPALIETTSETPTPEIVGGEEQVRGEEVVEAESEKTKKAAVDNAIDNSANFSVEPLISNKAFPYTQTKGLVFSLAVNLLLFLFIVLISAADAKEMMAMHTINETFMTSSFICIFICILGYFYRWIYGKWNQILDIRWTHILALTSLALFGVSILIDALT